MSGRIVDAAGRLPQAGALSVILPSDRGFWKVNGKLDGAAFRFSDVEPGRYRIVALAGEDPILYGPWFDVQAAEQKDVGDLTTEPAGSLRLTLVRGPGTEELQPTLWLTPAGGGHGRKVESAKGTELVIDNLCAGEYGITGYVAGMAAPRGRCTVVAGGEVRASIELRAAVAREIVVEYAADQQLHRIRITGSQDPPLLDYSPERTLERPYRITLQLPLGRLRFEVETKGGGKAHQEFEMTSLAAGQPPVVLRAQ